MLALAWRELHEVVRWQGLLGVLAIVGGIAAVGAASPARSEASPTALQWAAVLVVLGPLVLAPYALRATGRTVGTMALAISAGSAYAASALCSKALSNGLESRQVSVVLVALAMAGICAVLGFVGELRRAAPWRSRRRRPGLPRAADPDADRLRAAPLRRTLADGPRRAGSARRRTRRHDCRRHDGEPPARPDHPRRHRGGQLTAPEQSTTASWTALCPSDEEQP